MKNNIYVVIGSVFFILILAIIALPSLSRSFSRGMARYVSKGAVPLAEAQKNNCNGEDTICTVQEGKIVSKKRSSAELEQEKKKFVTDAQKHQQYATNVAAAIMAIRKYTNIPDLNLSPLNNSTPSHITYYCTTDNKCWAVDNERQSVVEIKK